MVDYIAPKNTEIPFKFGRLGYTSPDFNKINFEFEAGYATKDLKSAITGMDIQPDYLKSCDTQVVGYSSGTVQILKSNCIYGGYRDLQVLLQTSHYSDLKAYISTALVDMRDFNFVLRSWYRESLIDLRGITKGWLRGTSQDLPAYIREGFKSSSNLVQYLNIFQHQQEDFKQTIKGWSTGNFIDLVNAIKVSVGATSNFSEYIKATTQEIKDLNLEIYKIWQHNFEDITFVLSGWAGAELKLAIQSLHVANLPGFLRAVYFTNIRAYLYAVQPVDITAKLMGWAIKDLAVFIAKGDYQGDLPVSIYGIGSVNLPLTIDAKKGIQIIRDLNGYMTNFRVSDLSSFILGMSYSDLNFYLASSKVVVDLQCKIFPKIVFVRHNINISFLEHRDLAAAINFSCVSSAFRELPVTLVAKHKLELPCYVYGSDGSNIVNLSCFINSYDYITQDTILVNYMNINKFDTKLIVKYNNKKVYNMSTITVLGSDTKSSYANMSASIIGDFLHSDLGLSIMAYSNTHYSTTVSQRFVTLKLKNNIEDFRKYVEVVLNSYADSYYYFSGNKRAYRAVRDDHWVINIEGYKLLPLGSGFERTKVSRKYIFNLKKYDSIDMAITDIIDRVTLLRNSDLGVFIEAGQPINRDLSCSIMPKGVDGSINSRVVYKTNRVLKVSIIAGSSGNKELPTSIISVYNNDIIDLNSTITGIDYTGPTSGQINFNFEGPGDLIPESVDFVFIFGEN